MAKSLKSAKKPKRKLELTISIAGTDLPVYSTVIDEKEECWGLYLPGEPKHIILEKTMSDEHLWQTFIHEIFHAINDLYELGLTGDEEERFAGVMGKGYYQALKSYLPKAPFKRRSPRRKPTNE